MSSEVKSVMELEDAVFYDHELKRTPGWIMRQRFGHDNLKQDIQMFHGCGCKDCEKPLPLSNPSARIMVIGEYPSDVSFDSGEGKLLSDMLKKYHFNFDEVYFTSAIKCTGSNDFGVWASFLVSELLIVQPVIAICLGFNASKVLVENPQLGMYVQVLPYTTVLSTYAFRGSDASIVATLDQQFSYISSQIQQVAMTA